MGVRAKFFVEEKAEFCQQSGNWKGYRVKLVAAYGVDNREWASSSPSGSLEMVIANAKAAEDFKVGTYVFVDIGDPLPKSQPGDALPDSGKGYVNRATAGARVTSIGGDECRYFLDDVEVSRAEYERRTDPKTPLDPKPTA